MKKFLIILIAFTAVLISCNNYETYGDKKDKERNAISKFIADSSIMVISESQFEQQGNTTNLARNEFVKLSKSGVYLQIVREGCGTMVVSVLRDIARDVCTSKAPHPTPMSTERCMSTLPTLSVSPMV